MKTAIALVDIAVSVCDLIHANTFAVRTYFRMRRIGAQNRRSSENKHRDIDSVFHFYFSFFCIHFCRTSRRITISKKRTNFKNGHHGNRVSEYQTLHALFSDTATLSRPPRRRTADKLPPRTRRAYLQPSIQHRMRFRTSAVRAGR